MIRALVAFGNGRCYHGSREQDVIDLRSDTVTLPTQDMREAMARAEVGDDGWGEDPSVIRLEAMAAERMGKEAGLYTPSGTMANLVAVLTHCRRGDEAIVGSESHILHHELGGASALGGVVLRSARSDQRGMMDPEEVESLVRPEGMFPRSALLCLENTHNRCGGGVLTVDDTRALAGVARRHGMAVHLDGARIFNAALCLALKPSDLTAESDTVMFCFSKGLSAPVGSVLCGSVDFIARARRIRRMVGGGMRQAGVIAAAAIVALETMVERLAEDHENARLLARGLTELPGVEIDPAYVETNIVVFSVADAGAFLRAAQGEGVRLSMFGPRRVRAVTHYGIARADVEAALAALSRAARALTA